MIAVFGANGFIGQHLTSRLCDAGYPLRAVSRRFDDQFRKSVAHRADIVEADINEFFHMASALQDVHTVVQLISSSSPGMKNDHIVDDIKQNVVCQVAFLRLCVQTGVRRYIFLSSGGTIYGPDAAVPTPESSPTNPINSHGITKLAVEKYIQMYGHIDGLEYIILRVANPYGPGQQFRKGQGLIPAILNRWRSNLPIKIYGDGSAQRDYIYIGDLIDATESAICLDNSPKLIINIGSGVTRSVNDVLKTIENTIGCELEREFVEDRSTDVKVACLNISKAKKILDWRPTTSFEDGIRNTVAELQNPYS